MTTTLTPELTSLLEAQRDATEELPYELLGVRKANLVPLYVQQFVRDDTDAQPVEEDERKAVERTVSVQDALDAHDHLVITGEAGAGKSTVGHFYVQRLCRAWLDGDESPLRERVLPLRVPARALVVPESWSGALAAAARTTLGHLLDVTPTPELFAARQAGVRWLVFVDGLDEITDAATRTRLVRSIARQARRGANHRVVVTTRQPADASLEPLREAQLAFCGIRPFGREELADFAYKWFNEQDPRTAAARAKDFLRQTSDGRLRELVRNPLLATIAAIAATKAPERPLPAGRVDLYDGFIRALLDGGGRDVLAELRRVLADRPTRLDLARWTGERRTRLIGHLAVRRLESEQPLEDAAREWVAEHHADLPDGWEDDLRAILDDSGLFTRTGGELRFLHHSFAEFLAARHQAETTPEGFPDLERWITRGLTQHGRPLVLFTLVLWGRRHGLERVLRRLLDGGSDRVQLAASVLAEGGDAPEGLVEETRDRLLGLVLVGETGAGALLAAIGTDDRVTEALHALLDRPEAAVPARVEAAIALGGLVDARYAANRLEALIAVAGDDLERVVDGLVELVPDGAERAEAVLLRLARPDDRLFADCVDSLLDHKRVDAAAGLVREAVRRARAGDPGLGWPDFAEDCARLAVMATKADCPDEAVWAARRVLADPRADEWDFASAVQALVTVTGSVDEVLPLLAERSPDHAARAARRLSVGHPDAAAALARIPLSGGRWSDELALLLVDLEGPEALDELTGDGAAVVAESLLASTEAATEVKLRPARDRLADPGTDQYDFAQAAEVLAAWSEDGAREVVAAALERPLEHRVRVVDELCEAGRGRQAAEVADSVATAPAAGATSCVEVVGPLVGAGEHDAARRALAAAVARLDRSSSLELAGVAEAHRLLGDVEAGLAFAREAVKVYADTGAGGVTVVECLLDFGGPDRADEVLAAVRSRWVAPEVGNDTADVLAYRGLSAQAVALWLDVLVRPDPEKAFTAARKLLGYGQRDAAVRALREALAGAPEHERAGLRALLGYVVLSSPDADAQELLKQLRP